MAKALRKIQKRLAARREAFDNLKINKKAFIRPGSQNRHKQGSGGGTGGRRK